MSLGVVCRFGPSQALSTVILVEMIPAMIVVADRTGVAALAQIPGRVRLRPLV